jgi:glucosyl-3-phosphoglycerate phosphatase
VTRLVLVRHGQSSWNAERRIQGHAGSGLTEAGREQSDATARWVAQTHPDAMLVSSDLQRCVATAGPIAEQLGREPTLDPRLRERSYGRWEGRTVDDVAREDPDLWVRFQAGEDVAPLVGGESADDLAARVSVAFEEHLAGAGEDGTVVVVTHGGPIWHALHHLLALPWGSLGGVGNAGVSELMHDAVGWWCESWNQTAHLPVHLRTSFRPAETARG